MPSLTNYGANNAKRIRKPVQIISNRAIPLQNVQQTTGSKLTAEIIPIMPAHRCYVEVFAGAAWLLFRKPASKTEVINDINGELVNMYRVIKHHRQAFIDEMRIMPVARDLYNLQRATPPEVLTDIQRAVRFYYTLRTAFGAKVVGQTFTISADRPSTFNVEQIEQTITAASERLARVYIDNRPYHKVIDALDRKDTLFYLDPPYWDCENVYGRGLFSKDDFTRMAEQLAGIKGKFIMSINDVPQIRQLFAQFHIREVNTRYSLNKAQNKAVTELLITNYPLPCN